MRLAVAHGRVAAIQLIPYGESQTLMLAVSRPWTVRMLGSFRRHARGRPQGADNYLMLGCFERMLYPEVSRAAQRLSTRNLRPAADEPARPPRRLALRPRSVP